MSVNLLKLLQEYLSGDVVSNLAALIGEAPKNTETAVQTALPSLLAGLANKSSDSIGMNSLFNLIANENHDGGLLSNLGALSRGGEETDKLIASGGSLLTSLFGDKAPAIGQSISTASGISGKASNSLLGFAAPVVLGLIGKTLKLEKAETPDGLANLLKDQSGYIKSLLPAGLGSLLAFGPESGTAVPGGSESAFDKAVNSLDEEPVRANDQGLITSIDDDPFERIDDKIEYETEEAVSVTTEAPPVVREPAPQSGLHSMDEGQEFSQSAAAAFDDTEEAGSKILPWLLIAAALALIWGLLKSCGTEEKKPESTVTQTPAPPAPATPDTAVVAPPPPAPPAPVQAEPPKVEPPAPEQTSAFFERTLPTGYVIKAPKDGFESKLIGFIESNEPVGDDLWFNMDGIKFDTAKATIRAESQAQITYIAEVMKAYPKVEIKIGGYTDNTGKAASNLKLSGNRAKAVKKALVAKGIDASRLEAEGYGSEHPVASNDTPDGRQHNRRIDVRVTEK